MSPFLTITASKTIAGRFVRAHRPWKGQKISSGHDDLADS
jgi:hypothetical protein